MAERPILFSAPMVRAILEGRKTVTRRVVKMATPRAHSLHDWSVAGIRVGRCPYGQPGDRLWVRETWGQLGPFSCDDDPVFWRADYTADELREQLMPKWRPSIHMPRWASRIEVEVTSVRVQRLQEISDDDAVAESLHSIEIGSGYPTAYTAWPVTWSDVVEGAEQAHDDPRHAFRDLWESINGSGSWKANPFVWVIEFKRVEASHA